ncbi:MAG: type I phosphomannose isomerase catalytic subunit [Planctomycetota bacterium]
MTPAAYPLRFAPLIKHTIWGGNKLGTLLGKSIGSTGDHAESWEIVDHGKDQSIVTNGALQGTSLGELVRDHREWLMGEHYKSGSGGPNSPQPEGTFPLLLKYLDCNRVLSVQVHPDDEYGQKMDPPDLGKTEAWYVVDAEPGSLIYAGLRSGVDRSELSNAMKHGKTDEVLHQFEAHAGDCVFIPAGTVHALGAGLVIAEIQQSSDTTFRLFDWNRVGSDGQPRPLHIEASLDVTDYETGPVAPIQPKPGMAGMQPLVACDKFELFSLAESESQIGGDGRFHILTVPHGSAELQTSNLSLTLRRGESVLLPASIDACTLRVEQASTVLSACLPLA